MRGLTTAFLIFISAQYMVAQDSTAVAGDTKYREDQFYFAVTYNLLSDLPDGLSQIGFSSGFHMGFIRDMPFNKARTLAFGLGLGISANSFNQNMLIAEDAQGQLSFALLEDNSFTKNKFTNYLVEVPIELRWRNSSPTNYKFWRIHAGLKIGYIFASSSKFIGSPEDIKISNVDLFDKVQYGLTLSIGYNTWNAYLYYGANDLFKDEAILNGQSLSINAIKIGLIFYIL